MTNIGSVGYSFVPQNAPVKPINAIGLDLGAIAKAIQNVLGAQTPQLQGEALNILDGLTGDKSNSQALLEYAKGKSTSDILGHAIGIGLEALYAASPIGPIKGYPEDGANAWRKSNDALFTKAANDWNKNVGAKPGHEKYITPKMIKAWAIIESGSSGTKAAFLRDPMQVNNPRDWDKDKTRIAGLKERQVMTPATSINAALKWINYKGTEYNTKGEANNWRGWNEALLKYNGNSIVHRDGLLHKQWYANTVLSLSK